MFAHDKRPLRAAGIRSDIATDRLGHLDVIDTAAWLNAAVIHRAAPT